MSLKHVLIPIIAVAAIGLLVSCGSSTSPETVHADDAMVITEEDNAVVAEAVVQPARWNEVGLASGGTVAEVLVSAGDVVREGQLLVRLDSAQQTAAVAQAEAGVRRAQAHLDELRAGPRPQEIEAALAAIDGAQAQLERILQGTKAEEVSAAEAALGVAQASMEKVLEGSSEQQLIVARAELANAEAALQQAQAAYDRVRAEPDIAARPEALQLQQATHAYEAAKARLAALKNGPTVAEVAIVRAQVQQAKAHLDALKAPARSADVAAAQAEIRRAEAQLSLLEAGVRPETIAAAEADVAAATAMLEQAKATLAETELRAPFAGTVIEMDLEARDQVSPGQPLMTLASLDRFHVRTVDLMELDVARVFVGQPAVVTVDALPGHEFEGVVKEIALKSADYRGDVIFEVIIELATPERSDTLRWGMTAMVQIETE